MYFFHFFLFYIHYLLYIGLMTIWHTLYLYLVFIYIDVCYSPIPPCVVSFLSLYTCFLFIVRNLLFLFHTKMPWWVLFKVFQKYRLSKSFCHKISSCKVFRIDFIVFNKWVWVEWFMTSLIYSFVCCGFVTNFQMGRLLGHMWFNVRNICKYFM